MRTIHRSASVPYTPAQMFDLVNDIGSYPRFLPWCKAARVLQRDTRQIRAMLTVAKRGVEKSFTTLNLLQPPQRIEIRLVEGPFRRLDGL
jgi:ribosome-associated toxin RatA of RatAB toxin-antitoxin module